VRQAFFGPTQHNKTGECGVKNNVSRFGRSRALAAALFTVVAAALAWISPARAADPPPGCSTSAGQITCVFVYTGFPQIWIVPTGVTSASFYVSGAEGGAGGVRGGSGGTAFGTMSVTPGTAMQVNVGGQGSSAAAGGAGGWNGGGAGSAPSGGGGGGSDVRRGACSASTTCTVNDRFIVGGGGGGGGGVDIVGAQYYGGDGGGVYGYDGNPDSSSGNGKRGLSNQGGAGGANLCNGGPGGGNGGAGYGGAGTQACPYNGAGGGGGYFGGGGGGGVAVSAIPGFSGGGGSGYVDPGMTRGNFLYDHRLGDGLVVMVMPLKAPTAAKSFSKAAAAVDESVTLTFTITNPNPSAPLTSVQLLDSFPDGLVTVSPDGLRPGCNGGVVNSPVGASYITMAGGTLPPGGNCTFSVVVKGYTEGIFTNTADPVTAAQTAVGNAASASIIVGPTVPTTAAVAAMNFDVATAAVDQPVTLTFTITNPNVTAALTGVQLLDIFPFGLQTVSAVGQSAGCNGGVIDSQLDNVSLSGGTIPPNDSCTYSITVQGTLAGNLVNTTDLVTADVVGAGNTATASLNVGATKPLVTTKNFSQATAVVGETVTLTLTVTNPNLSSSLTGVSLTDIFPIGMKNVSPAGNSSGCNGGTIISASNYVLLDGGTLAPGAMCTFQVSAQGTTAGDHVNVAGPATSAEVGPGSAAKASISIIPLAPVANDVSAHVDANSSFNPVALDISGGAAASVAVASPPDHGTASASGTSILYTPIAGYLGADSFTYTATNTGGTSLPATVSVTVDDTIFANGFE
jgi:uncharacterized repeat protein (TIGR01451 family)